MHRIFLLIMIVFGSFALKAQQDMMTTLFWHTQLPVNPSFAGIDSRHEANALYRNQWEGVNGAPNSVVVSYAARVKKIHGGAGISFAADAIGFNRQYSVLGQYAFHQQLAKKYVLSIGVSAGWYQLGFKPGWVPPTAVSDPSLPGAKRMNKFDLSGGIAFIAPNWRVGFGTTHLNGKTLKNANGWSTYNTAIHSYFYGEYRAALSEKWMLVPRVQFITDYVKSIGEWSLAVHRGNLWGGVNASGLLEQHDFGGMLGYDIRGKYRVGYSYGYTTNKLSTVSKGTHEILLAFSIDGFLKRPVGLPQ